MIKWNYLFLVLICLSLSSCTTLLKEQEYVLIDQKMSEKVVFSGVVYSIPERTNVRKIILLGVGKVQNIDVYVRNAKNEWKFVKEIQRAIEFPYEILIAAHTDAIKIAHRSIVGRGRINTIQLYTFVEKKE